MIETRQPRIAAAIDAVDAERRIVSTEKRAFEAFLSRLADVDAISRSPTGTVSVTAGGRSMLADAGSPPSDALGRVRVAYRTTVMDVPHYETEYEDSLYESLTAEFGGELADCLVSGGELTPLVYEGLVQAAEEAQDERRRFRFILERERESLRRVETELDDCERRTVQLLDRIATTSHGAALSHAEAELADLETQCEALSSRRQETIHGRSIGSLSGIDDESLVTYLYGACEAPFPALADISRCVETIRNARRRCLR